MSEAATPHWCIVGPTHPFRGGIPRHTTLFTDAVAAAGIDVDLISFSRQYPRWLYKGETDRDDSQLAPQAVAPDHRLDGLGPRSWWQTVRVIERMSPDVLVLVWWHPFFAPMVSALLRGVRRRSPHTVRVALCHNVLPHESSPIDRLLVGHALAPAEGIALHASSQEGVARQLLGPRPTLVTPHPTYRVDASAPRPGSTDPDDGPLELVFFGLVRPYKGVDVLLRALPAVLRERRVRLTVAGEFWGSADPYVELVRELGLGDHVELRPGYVPDDELAKLLLDADLAVAPYRSATQSGAVEMAYGAGLPVVASRVGGLTEQVNPGVDGLLVPADDPPALAEALTEATEPATLARLTEGALARSSSRTWDGLVEDLRGFADELIRHRAHGA